MQPRTPGTSEPGFKALGGQQYHRNDSKFKPKIQGPGATAVSTQRWPKVFSCLDLPGYVFACSRSRLLAVVSVVFYFVARVVRTNPVGHFVLQAADVVSRSTAGRTGREAAVEEAGRTAVRRTVQRPGTTVQRWLGTPWKCRMRCLTVALLRAGARTKAMACVEPPGSIVVVVGGRLACRSARAVAAATVLQAVKLQAPN